MRFSLDANILVYALEADLARSPIAERVLLAALSADCLLTNQVIGEFLNVMRRKHPRLLSDARRACEAWSQLFPIAATTTTQLIEASALAERYRLQFWDSVVLTVAEAAGATWLLTEDMQDGATINGVRLLNPFDPGNAELLDALLAA